MKGQVLGVESVKRIGRWEIHRDRCLSLALHLGEDAANAFHARYKGDPGGERAGREYQRLIEAVSN